MRHMRHGSRLPARLGAVTLPDSRLDSGGFGERAVIRECDSGSPRAEAERRAHAELTGRREKSWLQ